MKKKVLLILSALLILLVAALPVSAADIYVGDAVASRGDKVSFSAVLSAPVDGVGMGRISVDYDPTVLTLVSGSCDVTGAMMVNFNVSNGKGGFMFATAQTVSGALFTVEFEVQDTAAVGQTNVTLNVVLYDADDAPIAVSGGNGTVTVSCAHANAYFKTEVPSTCKERGNAAGIYCPDCDTYTSGGELLPEVAHTYVGDYDGWGYKGSQNHERECVVCHEIEREPHSYGNWVPNTDTGEHEKVCSGCGDGVSEPHVFDAQLATSDYLASPADCHNAAAYYYSCSDCGLADKANTFLYGTPLEHVFEKTIDDAFKVSDASCQSPAIYSESCVCGEIGPNTFEVGTVLPHTYTEVVDDAFKVSAADCLNAAVYYKSCTCGDKSTETFISGTALGHDFAKQYTHDDKEHYYECLRDDCDVTDGREQHKGGTATCSAQATCDACQQPYGELADHTYDQETVDVSYLKSEANCTQAALYYKSCVCGEKGSETFSSGAALGHDFAKEYSSNVNYHYYECLRAECNATDGRAQHNGGQATCENLAVCADCNKEYGSLRDHNYGAWASKGEDAQERQCQDCLTWETTAHEWDSGVVTTPATESTPGEKVLTCLDCGETKKVEVPPLTHTHVYTTEWKHNDTSHWYECLCGERANVNDHTWDKQVTQAATCESKGIMALTCSACGHTATEEIPLADHTWDAGTVTTPATEQAAGVMTHVCTVCRESKTEEIAQLEHTHTAAGEGDWSSDDTHHWIACSCGDRLNEGAHIWLEEITTPASCEGKGVKTYTCSACGFAKTEEIAQLEHTWNEGEITTEATEDAAGVKTYTCTACGSKDRTEEIPRLEPTEEPDIPVIPVEPKDPQGPSLLLFIIILLICLIIILLVIILYMRKNDRYR